MAVDAFVAERVIRTRHFRASHKYGEPGMLPKKKRVNETVDPAKLDNFEKGVTFRAKRGYWWLIDSIQMWEIMNPGYLAHYLQIPQECSEEARLNWLAWARKGENYTMPPWSLWPFDSLIAWQNLPETLAMVEEMRARTF